MIRQDYDYFFIRIKSFKMIINPIKIYLCGHVNKF